AGYLLRGIVGYSAAPTLLESSAYVAYWIVVALVYLGIRSGKITAVSEPLRRAWRALLGRKTQPPADLESARPGPSGGLRDARTGYGLILKTFVRPAVSHALHAMQRDPRIQSDSSN